MDLFDEPLLLIDSARSKSAKPKEPRPRVPALKKLRREIPSQFLDGPPVA